MQNFILQFLINMKQVEKSVHLKNKFNSSRFVLSLKTLVQSSGVARASQAPRPRGPAGLKGPARKK